MKKMQTLTLGGNTYQIYDPEAARVDDTKVGETVWSSRAIADRLCPEFSIDGDVVVCQPVAGYPLAVVSEIEPVQTGEPKPQTPCPIVPHTTVKLTLSNPESGGEYLAELDREVYAGTYDWSECILTITHKLLTLTGEESAGLWKISGADIYTTGIISDHDRSGQSINGLCSHAPQNNQGLVDSTYLCHANKNVGGLSFNKVVANWGFPECSVAALVAFLKAQYAAGTPVQVLYKLGTPQTVKLTDAPVWEREQIYAMEGQNTLQSDTGKTTVTGRADPAVLLQKLLNNSHGTTA